jgi:hypothetical protein
VTTPAITPAQTSPDPASASAGAGQTASGDTQTTSSQTAATKPWTPPTSQEELDRIISDRLTRERGKYADYDDLKAKAAKWEQAEDAAKTEAQRALERAEKAERALKDKQDAEALAALRTEVADAKQQDGLPLGAADLLVGVTREELEASADRLITVFGAAAKKGAAGPYVPSEGKPADSVRADKRSPRTERSSALSSRTYACAT